MQKNEVVIETDVGKLTWQPRSDCCELLARELGNEKLNAMRVSAFAELEEVLRGVLPSLISKTLAAERKIKEHVRFAEENAIAIETARRKGFLALQAD